MKRGFLISLLVLLLMVPLYSAGDFSISFTGNYLSPSDDDYKKTYGSGVFYPELKLGYEIAGNFSLWAGFGILSAKGNTPILEAEAKSSQKLMSFGVGYNGDFSRKLGYKVELGAVYFSYKEEAMEVEVTGSAFGFRADAGIIFNITGTFFAELTVGYISAGDTVTLEGEDEDIKFGGVKGGIGLGIRF
ncbi:MAG: outer membrane beta-barrel protein [Candidatus Aminicenantes bacterium]|nr:outer membrane beta-barrel protein [Candidatus Aminicenantes bacterium]